MDDRQTHIYKYAPLKDMGPSLPTCTCDLNACLFQHQKNMSGLVQARHQDSVIIFDRPASFSRHRVATELWYGLVHLQYIHVTSMLPQINTTWASAHGAGIDVLESSS